MWVHLVILRVDHRVVPILLRDELLPHGALGGVPGRLAGLCALRPGAQRHRH